MESLKDADVRLVDPSSQAGREALAQDSRNDEDIPWRARPWHWVHACVIAQKFLKRTQLDSPTPVFVRPKLVGGEQLVCYIAKSLDRTMPYLAKRIRVNSTHNFVFETCLKVMKFTHSSLPHRPTAESSRASRPRRGFSSSTRTPRTTPQPGRSRITTEGTPRSSSCPISGFRRASAPDRPSFSQQGESRLVPPSPFSRGTGG